MVKFIDVDPSEIPNHREGRRGRVSYPILKSFLETNKPVAQLDRTGMQQSFQSLYSSLGAYIRNHDLPIKLFSRQNEIYLLRLDLKLDGEGNIVRVENWRELEYETTEGHAASGINDEPTPLDEDEVDRRFQEERGQVTK
jgi:hypothetical protein